MTCAVVISSCLIVVTFVFIIVVMVITATLLAVFLSPRNVTFTCSKVLVTNWTAIKPINEQYTTGEDFDMKLQVLIVCVCSV